MKKTIIHSSVFLLAFLLTACNNNDTGSKVTSQKEENSSETKSVEYAEIGSGDRT
jgi:predicted small secreted protein